VQKEALYYKKLKNKIVQCNLCPKTCIIKPNQFGNCNARKNINGKLYSLIYNKPYSIAIDPIEKKPLYHFMPKHQVFSIGTTGCNLHCDFCQNWSISQIRPEISNKSENELENSRNFQRDKPKDFSPERIIQETIDSGCKIIAYTYNEPIIFYEYMLETAKLAKKSGIKNIMISNGFINQEPLKELLSYIDAANIDLKSIKDDFYRKYCDAWIKPILESLKTINSSKTHLEITNLIISKINDNLKEIDALCKWIKTNLGTNIPLHFSAFYPCYKMLNLKPTQKKTLFKAKQIARKNNIKYIYLGNI
jgi:pyruvate formate lyase activating enzyme